MELFPKGYHRRLDELTIADKANRRIAAIYHVDNMYKESSLEERLDNRKNSVKPLVDEYFTWLKSRKTISAAWFLGQISYRKAAKSKTSDSTVARRGGNF